MTTSREYPKTLTGVVRSVPSYPGDFYRIEVRERHDHLRWHNLTPMEVPAAMNVREGDSVTLEYHSTRTYGLWRVTGKVMRPSVP